ncbi:hypothetical protein HN51_025723 [Arachis hypogaea]
MSLERRGFCSTFSKKSKRKVRKLMSKSAPSNQSRINLLDPKDEVVQECQNMNWGTFKTLLTDALIDHLHPIQV